MHDQVQVHAGQGCDAQAPLILTKRRRVLSHFMEREEGDHVSLPRVNVMGRGAVVWCY